MEDLNLHCFFFFEFGGSLSLVFKASGLLGYDGMLLGEFLPPFRRNLLFSRSRAKQFQSAVWSCGVSVSLCQATVCNTALVYILHLNGISCSSWTAWLLKMEAPFSVETSGTGHRKTQRRIPEDLNLFLSEIFGKWENDLIFFKIPFYQQMHLLLNI